MKMLIECHHGIGDVVMTFPALYNLRELYPDAQIDILLGIEAVAPIVEMTKLINHYYILNDRKASQLGMVRFAIGLRNEHYDIGIAMGQSPRGIDVLLLKIAGCKRIIGMKNNRAIYKRYEQVDVSGCGHRTFQYLEYINYLGGEGIIPNKTINLESEKLLHWEKEIKQRDKKNIGVFIGAGSFMIRTAGKRYWYNNKKWELSKWKQLSDDLLSKGFNIVLLGGKEDFETMKEDNISFSDSCRNYIGQVALEDTVYILANCDLVVGCDSGPMHCAAAVGVPALTLFGATDSSYIGPIGENSRYIYADTDCTKCYPYEMEKGVHCIPPKCMKALSVENVLNEILNIIQ